MPVHHEPGHLFSLSWCFTWRSAYQQPWTRGPASYVKEFLLFIKQFSNHFQLVPQLSWCGQYVGWTWRPGIVRNSDEEEIKGAYRRMAKQFHPDGCYLLLLLLVHVYLACVFQAFVYLCQIQRSYKFVPVTFCCIHGAMHPIIVFSEYKFLVCFNWPWKPSGPNLE